MHKMEDKNFGVLEAMGILGGFLSLYQKITSLLGRILIGCLYKTKKNIILIELQQLD